MKGAVNNWQNLEGIYSHVHAGVWFEVNGGVSGVRGRQEEEGQLSRWCCDVTLTDWDPESRLNLQPADAELERQRRRAFDLQSLLWLPHQDAGRTKEQEVHGSRLQPSIVAANQLLLARCLFQPASLCGRALHALTDPLIGPGLGEASRLWPRLNHRARISREDRQRPRARASTSSPVCSLQLWQDWDANWCRGLFPNYRLQMLRTAASALAAGLLLLRFLHSLEVDALTRAIDGKQTWSDSDMQSITTEAACVCLRGACAPGPWRNVDWVEQRGGHESQARQLNLLLCLCCCCCVTTPPPSYLCFETSNWCKGPTICLILLRRGRTGSSKQIIVWRLWNHWARLFKNCRCVHMHSASLMCSNRHGGKPGCCIT